MYLQEKPDGSWFNGILQKRGSSEDTEAALCMHYLSKHSFVVSHMMGTDLSRKKNTPGSVHIPVFMCLFIVRKIKNK